MKKWSRAQLKNFVKQLGLEPGEVDSFDGGEVVETSVGDNATIRYDDGVIVVSNDTTGAESTYENPLTAAECEEIRGICNGVVLKGNHR